MINATLNEKTKIEKTSPQSPAMAAARPRVIVDARMVGETPHGFSRYVTSLARGLRARTEEEGGSLPYHVRFLVSSEWTRPDFHGFPIEAVSAPFLAPAELIALPLALRRTCANLYHSPTFSSLAPFTVPCPWIVTVHDLNHLAYGGAAQKLYYRGLLRPFARGSRRLLTVSRASAAELAPWSGVESDRIGVVYNALDEASARAPAAADVDAALERHGLRRGAYFFCVTNPKPHKNVRKLLSAYARYRRAGSAGEPWPLALNLSPEQVAQLAEDPAALEGVRALGALPEADVRALYAAAGAVAFPSRYEGFGLPPIEAAAAGAPIIVSRIPPHEESLAELADGEVAWADPRSTEDWTRCLARASRGELHSPSEESRARLLRRFGTERMGREMDRIYRAVLGLSS